MKASREKGRQRVLGRGKARWYTVLHSQAKVSSEDPSGSLRRSDCLLFWLFMHIIFLPFNFNARRDHSGDITPPKIKVISKSCANRKFIRQLERRSLTLRRETGFINSACLQASMKWAVFVRLQENLRSCTETSALGTMKPFSIRIHVWETWGL